MDARRRVDPRGPMPGSMMPLSVAPIEGQGGRPRSSRGSGPPLWDVGPYGGGSYAGSSYSNQASRKFN